MWRHVRIMFAGQIVISTMILVAFWLLRIGISNNWSTDATDDDRGLSFPALCSYTPEKQFLCPYANTLRCWQQVFPVLVKSMQNFTVATGKRQAPPFSSIASKLTGTTKMWLVHGLYPQTERCLWNERVIVYSYIPIHHLCLIDDGISCSGRAEIAGYAFWLHWS